MNDQILKEYKYKITEEDFHYLFLADDTDFENIKLVLGENGKGLRRTNNYVEITDTIIKDNIILRGIKKPNCANLTLKNVKAKSILILGSDLDIHSNKTNLRLENCDIGNFDAQNSTIGEIHFTSCSFGEIKLRKTKVEDVNISNCIIERFSYFKDTIIKDLCITGSIVDGDLDIDGCTVNAVNFRQGSFKKLYIGDITSNSITFNKISTDIIWLSNTKIGSIYIEKSITGDLRIFNSRFNQFYAGSHYCSISISNTSIPQLRLHNCFISVLEFSQICNIVADIAYGQINKVHFRKAILNKESLISFSETLIQFLQIEELSMLGNLYFRHIKKADKRFEWFNLEVFTKELELKKPMLSKIIIKVNEQFDQGKDDYEKESNGTMSNINESTIRISKSSLGKTEFIDCSLADFRFEFNHSKVTDCFVSGGSIPISNVHIIGTTPKSTEEHQQKASFFNQFKKIFEAQGDIYHATQFQAKWADEQRNLLELIHQKEKGWFNTTFSDLWILKLNKWSNLHGESWPRAFFWILVLGLVFYLTYLFSIGRLFTPGKFDFNLIGYYFEFLNPAHKFNFINEGNIANGLTVFIDVVWRIIVAYLIYQFISAFRKHTKKQ